MAKLLKLVSALHTGGPIVTIHVWSCLHPCIYCAMRSVQ